MEAFATQLELHDEYQEYDVDEVLTGAGQNTAVCQRSLASPRHHARKHNWTSRPNAPT